jgi:hypothetical protein
MYWRVKQGTAGALLSLLGRSLVRDDPVGLQLGGQLHAIAEEPDRNLLSGSSASAGLSSTSPPR